jgi:hypothetical protein
MRRLNSQKAGLGARTPAAKRGLKMKLGARKTRFRIQKKQPAILNDRRTIGSIRFSEAPFERLEQIGVNHAVAPSIRESEFVGGAYGFFSTKLGDKIH